MSNPVAVNIPIIAMTANAFEEDRQLALAAGMNEHITKPYSEKTAELIDAEAKAIIDDVTARTRKLLMDNWSGVEQIANILIDKEVIMAEDIEAIFGPKAGKHGEERLAGAEDSEAADAGAESVTETSEDTATDE